MKHLGLFILGALLLASCATNKRAAYLQQAQADLPTSIEQDYQIRIKPLDRLTVTVNSKDPELAAPFNAATSYNSLNGLTSYSSSSNGVLQILTVDKEGKIQLPIIGEISCNGLTRNELAEKISKYARVKLDDSDNAPGWKFSQWEMKGVPLRLEIGPKDLEKNQCVLVRRDTREKVFVSLDELETAIPAQLEALRKDLYERALANREKRTWAATTMDEVKELAKANTGYIKTMWCGDLACEMKMKEEVGLSSRCMPFEQEHLSDVCPCCGKPAKTMVYWGVAY